MASFLLQKPLWDTVSFPSALRVSVRLGTLWFLGITLERGRGVRVSLMKGIWLKYDRWCVKLYNYSINTLC